MIDFSKPMRVKDHDGLVVDRSRWTWHVLLISGQTYAVRDDGAAFLVSNNEYHVENIPEKPQPKVRYQAQMEDGITSHWHTEKLDTPWYGGVPVTAWLIETDHGPELPDDERYEYRREVVK